MKTTALALLLSCALLPLSLLAQARTITLVVNNGVAPGPTIQTNFVQIGSNEVARILASGPLPGPQSCGWQAVINGVTFSRNQFGEISNLVTPIAGPAEIRFYSLTPGASAYGYLTLEITPATFPPGQTLILPAGTVGVVHAQSSTNLIHWQDEWTHTFSNTNDNRFFRLTAERSAP